ncbi:MAG: LCCL domain-containing protein [Rhodanobacter sp.]
MNVITARLALVAALTAALPGCQGGPSAASMPTIDWRTSPLDLNLRGMIGTSYLFRCPPGKPSPESVIGSGIYTDASSICAASAHAGAISPKKGGVVMIQMLPGQPSYRGSMQNFIFSSDYPQTWGGSFAVLSGAEPPSDRKP